MYPACSHEDALQVMGSFDQVTPLATKLCEMVFLCVCAGTYQLYTCVEAIVLSMLFNPDLKVPDNLQQKQLKDRESAELANPFTTRLVKEKERGAARSCQLEARFFIVHCPAGWQCSPHVKGKADGLASTGGGA